MKVLVHYNGAFSHSAGVSRATLGLGEALKKKGVSVQYLFGYSKSKKAYLNCLNGFFHFLHHTPLTALLFALSVRGKDFDFVISNTPEAAFDSTIACILLRKKYKVVVSLHGLDKGLRKEWQNELRNGFVEYSFRQDLYLLASLFKSRLGIRLADSHSSVSHFVAEQAEQFYGVPKLVVPNGVDCKELKQVNKKIARKKLGLGEKEFVVLFVGNASWVKGLRYLVESIKNVPDSKLLIAGLKRNEEISALLGDRVKFSGYVNRKNLALHYSAADVLCVPSVYEAFGLMYAEAMSFGLPCVASKETGASETVKHGFNGFLLGKRDVNGISSVLRKLSNPSVRRRLSVNAKKTARLMVWKKSAVEILRLLNGLISE